MLDPGWIGRVILVQRICFKFHHLLLDGLKNGLKTSDLFSTRGLGSTFQCLLCFMELESHSHMFFECEYSIKVMRKVPPKGHFFLMCFSTQQVFEVTTKVGCNLLKS